MTDLAVRLIQNPVAFARAEWALDTLRNATGADCAVIGFPESEARMCRILATGIEDVPFDELSPPVACSARCASIVETASTVAVEDIDTLPDREDCAFMNAEGFRGYLGTPVRLDTTRPAAIVVVMAREPRSWHSEDWRRVTETAGAVASIIKECISRQGCTVH